MKVVDLEDQGQDFTRWTLDETGLVVDCQPSQAWLWCGSRVPNHAALAPGSILQVELSDAFGRLKRTMPLRYRAVRVWETPRDWDEETEVSLHAPAEGVEAGLSSIDEAFRQQLAGAGRATPWQLCPQRQGAVLDAKGDLVFPASPALPPLKAAAIAAWVVRAVNTLAGHGVAREKEPAS